MAIKKELKSIHNRLVESFGVLKILNDDVKNSEHYIKITHEGWTFSYSYNESSKSLYFVIFNNSDPKNLEEISLTPSEGGNTSGWKTANKEHYLSNVLVNEWINKFINKSGFKKPTTE
jgi:hypothetical protein